MALPSQLQHLDGLVTLVVEALVREIERGADSAVLAGSRPPAGTNFIKTITTSKVTVNVDSIEKHLPASA